MLARAIPMPPISLSLSLSPLSFPFPRESFQVEVSDTLLGLLRNVHSTCTCHEKKSREGDAFGERIGTCMLRALVEAHVEAWTVMDDVRDRVARTAARPTEVSRSKNRNLVCDIFFSSFATISYKDRVRSLISR